MKRSSFWFIGGLLGITLCFSPLAFSTPESAPSAQEEISHGSAQETIIHVTNGEHGAATDHGDAHGGGHHIASWEEVFWPLVYRIINFVAFVAIMVFFLRKPISKALADRRSNVEEVIKASAERKAWAEQMYVDYNRRLQDIGREIDDLRASLRKEGEEESRRILEHARQLSESLKKESMMLAGAEMDQFKKELRAEVIEKAAVVARETLMKALNEKDEERLTKEVLGQFSQGGLRA